MNRSYIGTKTVELLPFWSVLVSTNVVILCWLCTKWAGAHLVHEGRWVSQVELPYTCAHQQNLRECFLHTQVKTENKSVLFGSADRPEVR